jgi:hypothetical protein
VAAYEMQLAILQQMAEDEVIDAHRRVKREEIRNKFYNSRAQNKVIRHHIMKIYSFSAIRRTNWNKLLTNSEHPNR